MHLLALMGLFVDQNVRFAHPFRSTPTSAPAVSKSCCLTKTNKLSNNKTAKNKEIRVFPIFRTVKRSSSRDLLKKRKVVTNIQI